MYHLLGGESVIKVFLKTQLSIFNQTAHNDNNKEEIIWALTTYLLTMAAAVAAVRVAAAYSLDQLLFFVHDDKLWRESMIKFKRAIYFPPLFIIDGSMNESMLPAVSTRIITEASN